MTTTLIVLVIVFFAGVVAASPYALRALDPSSPDWEQLSWVGQTYGAASALLSVFALIGIAISLILQAREAKAAREQSLRAVHAELLQMAMDDEVYRRCWGPFFASGDADAQRQHMYVNLIISNLQMRHELDAIAERHLRSTAHILFSGEVARRFWAEGRELRWRAAAGRRERRFLQILDEEHQHACESPAAPPAPASHPPESGSSGWSPAGRSLLLGIIAAGAAASVPLVRRALRRHRGR